MSSHVMAKFKRDPDGKLRNERLELERLKQATFSHIQSEKGRLGGRPPKAGEKPGLSRGFTEQKPEGKPGLSRTKAGEKAGVKPAVSVSVSVSDPVSASAPTKLPTKFQSARAAWREIAKRIESALGPQWVNDAGKWVNRSKEQTNKTERVIAEVENAIKEKRIATTPAQYAEQIWTEFK